MKQYLELIKRVIDTGEWTENRTGIRTKMLPGAAMAFDLREGFPAITTKKLAFKAVIGELCAFMRASTSAADFRALGCKVWDQNANENKAWLNNPFREGTDDLGPVYGAQWRNWQAFKQIRGPRHGQTSELPLYQLLVQQGYKPVGATNSYHTEHVDGPQFNYTEYTMHKEIDQLGDCVRTIINNPDSRRILFHGWNPADLDAVALPACHLLYQFMPNPNTGLLHMNLYIRSNDLGLGAPFNIAEGAVLLSLIARLTGYTPGVFNYFIGDAHVYENHFDMVHTQLSRAPHALPTLVINERVPFGAAAEEAVEWLAKVEPSDFALEGYTHHDPIKAEMAV